jgi:hypothetical protein
MIITPTALRLFLFARGCPVIACASSIQLNPAAELLVLVADELDQLLVGQEPLIDTNRPRPRIRLRIDDGEVDPQMAEGWAPEALDERRLSGVRALVHIEPPIELAVFRAAQVVGLDDEIVALPTADRVAVPPGLRVALRRQLSSRRHRKHRYIASNERMATMSRRRPIDERFTFC